MSKEQVPGQEKPRSTISRRAFLASGAGLMALGFSGAAYSNHETDSIDDSTQFNQTSESELKSPTLMGATERLRIEAYKDKHVPLILNTSVGLMSVGGLVLLGDIVNKKIIKPFKAERALFQYEDVLPEASTQSRVLDEI